MDLLPIALGALAGFCLGGVVVLLVALRHRSNNVAYLEEQIAERTGALRTLSRAIEQSPSSVVITDPEGRITYANPSFARLTGYALDEVRGRNPRFLQSGQHPAAFYRDLWHTLEARDEWRGQFSNRTKGGEIYWEAATISAVRDEAGALTHYVKVAEDITERKRAEEALQRRVEELAMLNDVAQTVATVTDLPAALERVARTVAHVLDASITIINVLQDDELEVLGWYEREPAGPEVVGRRFPLDGEVPAVLRALSEGETLIVPNQRDNLQSPLYREHMPLHVMGSVMLVPLLARGTAVGLMEVGTCQGDRGFTRGEVSLAETIAGDIAAAIDNARLLAQARVTAVGEERQRLARDLHDAVTQTIYSASLIAEALPRIWERNPAEAKRNLVKLRQLTRGALAEMRTLLFELRPGALEEASLETLLRQLGDAMTGRTRIPVTFDFQEGLPPGLFVEGIGLAPGAKIALYRIAQEAFNNIAKHSGATQVAVALRRTPDQIMLNIQDNGQGFDPGAVSGDHLGLGIMAERAGSAGAGLEIVSRPGAGTCISVTLPVLQPG
jgi:PAS domain S-box-containing protein